MNIIIIVLNKKRIVNLRLENMNLDIKYPCALLKAGARCETTVVETLYPNPEAFTVDDDE